MSQPSITSANIPMALLPFAIIGVLIIIGIGIVEAYWGYKLQVLFRFLPGLVAGALIGAATGFCLSLHPAGAVLGAMLTCVVCAVISSASEKAGVFLEVFAYPYGLIVLPVILFALTPTLQIDGNSGGGSASPLLLRIVSLLFAAAISSVFGWLVSRFASRAWIILTTSLAGGILGGFGFAILLPAIGILAAPVMIVSGAIVQFTITAAPKKVDVISMMYTQPAQQPPVPDPAPAAPTCPTCGTSLEPDARFCPQCGQTVAAAPAPTTCPSCGAPLKPGTRFCSQCGQSVGGALPGTEQPYDASH